MPSPKPHFLLSDMHMLEYTHQAGSQCMSTSTQKKDSFFLFVFPPLPSVPLSLPTSTFLYNHAPLFVHSLWLIAKLCFFLVGPKCLSPQGSLWARKQPRSCISLPVSSASTTPTSQFFYSAHTPFRNSCLIHSALGLQEPKKPSQTGRENLGRKHA